MELNIVDKSENEWKRRAIFTWQKMCVCVLVVERNRAFLYGSVSACKRVYKRERKWIREWVRENIQQFISNENSLGCFRMTQMRNRLVYYTNNTHREIVFGLVQEHTHTHDHIHIHFHIAIHIYRIFGTECILSHTVKA